MKMNYEIVTFNNISRLRFINPPSLDDVKKAISDLAISQPPLRLRDLSCGMNLSAEELRQAAEPGKLKFTGLQRWL